MEKMKMQSENLVDENVEKIAKLFPNCITEGKDEDGKVVRAVDFDLLKQELSKDLVEGNDERYTLNWAGKKQSILTANSPINATLRPCEKESVGKDGTPGGWDSQNLYIEGDNLDVLKLLRETYLNKIKMIYIDPPYNTGNDFVYNDDFATSADEYLQNSKSYDEDGNRMVQNLESNGRFHSDWLSMMYPRLKLAKDFLTEDGLILISIDDNEQANLKKICDEIFGARNFLLNICVNRTSEIASNFTIFKHEYLVVYVKDIDKFNLTTIEKYSVSRGTVGNADQTMPIIEFPAGLLCKNIPDGVYEKTRKLDGSSENIENFDPIVVENGRLKYPVKLKARWRSSNDMRNFFNNNCQPTPAKINGEVVEIYFENDRFNPQIKKKTYEKIPSMYLENKRGSEDLKRLKLDGCFDFPKSVSFIKYILSFTHKNDIIMDFFSGSGTTAQAIMEKNLDDYGNRKFILVQLPENLDENLLTANSQSKETIKNAIKICDAIKTKHILSEVSKERIRRAGMKIVEEIKNASITFGKNRKDVKEMSADERKSFDKAINMASEKLNQEDGLKNLEDFMNQADRTIPDIGFRVLKLDSSNMKDVYYTPAETPQASLLDLVSNIKEDRSPEDLLFQVMLDMGVMLDSKIEKIELSASKQAFNVNDGNLICCFDINLSEEDVTKIAKMQPLYAVFRDSSMASDSVAVNFGQIFETYSPSTTRKVL